MARRSSRNSLPSGFNGGNALVHFGHEHASAPAAPDIDRHCDDTQKGRNVIVIGASPRGQWLVHADDFNPARRVAEPVAGRPQNARLSRVADAHVTRRDLVECKRIGRGIEPERRLRSRATHDTDQPVRRRLECVQQSKIRRKRIQQHHDGRLSLSLSLRKKVLVTSRSNPLHIGNAQIGQLDGVAPHLAEGNSEIGILPAPADGSLRKSAPI